MIRHLLVYGSLAPGQENAHWLKPLKGHWQVAEVKGRLYREGLTGTKPYPALILDQSAPWVAGQVFFSPRLPSLWPQLDAFEGRFYRRQVCNVRVFRSRSGQGPADRRLAWVYAYAPPARHTSSAWRLEADHASLSAKPLR